MPNGGVQVFNIGPLELIFILVIMILLLGPDGMKRTIRQLGIWLREARQSTVWKEIQTFIHQTQDLPVQIVREAGFQEQIEELQRGTPISIDLYEPPASQPGDVRSPGKRRLRPPQRMGVKAAPRTEQTVLEPSEEAPVVETTSNE